MKKEVIGDKDVLLKRNNRYCMTRVNAYYRYLHTIKPLDDLLKGVLENDK